MTTSEKEEVLATVNGFLVSISNKKPPFPDALQYILPDSYAVLSHPDELIQCTLGELVTRLEGQYTEIYASGATSAGVSIVEPGPDVWVGNRLAVVWAGYSSKVDGEEKQRGVNIFGLFKREEGWKIGTIADTQWKTDEELPPVVNKATDELMAPVHDLTWLSNEAKWYEAMRTVLPGGGATYCRFPDILITPLWPEWFADLEFILQRASGFMEYKLMDWDGRIMGDLGLVWTAFTVTVDDDIKVTGFNIFTMLKKDGKWLISGCQDG